MRRYRRNEFDLIYDEYYERVFMAALGFMKDKYRAEEIFQSTFLELFMKIEEIQDQTVWGWLKKVVKNKSLNELKKISKESKKLQSVESDFIDIPCDGSFGELKEKVKRKAYLKLSVQIFEALYDENKTWYEAMFSVYCIGKPQKEVADEMNISIGTLYSILFRARNWVKKNYSQQYKELEN